MWVKKFNWNNYQIISAILLFIRDVSNCDDNAREYHLKKKTNQAIKQQTTENKTKQTITIKFHFF